MREHYKRGGVGMQGTRTAAAPVADPLGQQARRRATGLRAFFARLMGTRMAPVASFIIALLVLTAVFAPIIAPYGVEEGDFAATLTRPNREHLMGTDTLGRDIFSRVIYGSRVSLQVGVIAVGIAMIIGTAFGLVAGYTRIGLLESTIMRAMDALLAFPTLVLALAITAALGPSLTNVMIAVGIVGIPGYARLVRGQVLSVREREFIEAARTIGVSDLRIMLRHILPNVTAPLIVQASLGVAFAILSEASLSFLGLGVQPPTPSWGNMLEVARNISAMENDLWQWAPAGIAIVICVLAINFIGDGLREALDPRL